MSETPKKRLRTVLRVVAGMFGLLLAACVIALAVAWVPMGKMASGERAERVAASPNFGDGVFVNPQPLWNDVWGSITASVELSEYAVPSAEIPVASGTAVRLAEPASGLRVTWLGHSTTVVELAGRRVLTDPVFGESPFPIPALGPKRWYPPPISLDELTDVDAVLISHDHYDHLDYPTISRIAQWNTVFVVPLGVGSHLEYWGVPPDRIIELDWWEEHTIGDLRIAATPARHASGRQALDQNGTLWAGYALIGPEHRVMFSGDTGLFDDMEVIGERYGPFDLVMIEVGAYHRAWPDWHIGPEQAIRGHEMMRGAVFMPIHWGLFNLALHGWTEPVERLTLAAKKEGVRVVVPRPGESFDPTNPPELERWWPDVPWETAEEHPVVSTRSGNPDDRY